MDEFQYPLWKPQPQGRYAIYPHAGPYPKQSSYQGSHTGPQKGSPQLA